MKLLSKFCSTFCSNRALIDNNTSIIDKVIPRINVTLTIIIVLLFFRLLFNFVEVFEALFEMRFSASFTFPGEGMMTLVIIIWTVEI